ncbi:MAG: hypothetical protein ACREF3_10025 [Acetobacteraceae bacterium]
MSAGKIFNFVLSCRVIGLGGERALLDAIAAAADCQPITGRIAPTGRNLPVQ